MNNLDKQYIDLVNEIIKNGVLKQDRTGTGTIALFGKQIRHKMSDGFPLLTTKKMYVKGVITELIWFLRGDTNIKFLLENDCHIWDGDAYKNYRKVCGAYEEPDYDVHIDDPNENSIRLMTQIEFITRVKTDDDFAKKWGDLGPIYGKQWRAWGGYEKVPSSYEHGAVTHHDEVPLFDQITKLINDIKNNPDSRRLIVSAWNVSEIDEAILPPCHNFFQVFTRELNYTERLNLASKTDNGVIPIIPMYTTKEEMISWFDEISIPSRAISLSYNARSQDLPLGTPFNLASYGLLLVILGKMVNMVPDELISNMGDCHIYLNQIDSIKEQLDRTSYQLPTLKINTTLNFTGTIDDFLASVNLNDFIFENYLSHPSIKIPLSN